MPEIKNTFLKGRMNKDLDERLIANGEYRDASNIQVSSTEASDAGTVQNILGNIYANKALEKSFTGDGSTKIFDLDYNPLPASTNDFEVYINNTLQSTGNYTYDSSSGVITFTTAPGNNLTIKILFFATYGLAGKCVGSFADEENNKIYLFIKGTSINGIIEYNAVTETSIPVLIDARASNKVLNFTDAPITGIAMIQGFLIFTDNFSEPKIIDITDKSIFKLGSLIDGGNSYTTTTQVKRFQKQADGTVLRVNENFRESDITLIKKSPNSAPKFIIKTNGDSAATNALSEENNIIHSEKFIRFAYRWKFTNGQYSPISPFTQVLFFPSKDLSYDLAEGFNKQMINNITDAKLVNIEHGSGQATLYSESSNVADVEFIEILYKESLNENLYLYKTLTRQEAQNSYYTGISINGESKQSVIPSDQLMRAYDNVPYRAKALDIVGNRLVFGNYKDGIDLEGFDPKFTVITESKIKVNDEADKKYITTGGALASGFASMADSVLDTTTVKSGRDYQVGIVFEDEYGRETPVVTNDTAFHKEPYSTQQGHAGAGRNFKIKMDGHPPGVIEFTGDGSRKLFSLPEDLINPIINFPTNTDDFTVTVNGVLQVLTTNYTYDTETGMLAFVNAPTAQARIIVDASRVKRFKYYIKQSSGEYYNVIVTGLIKGQGGTCYLLSPSVEFNKVKEGQYLQLKKPLNDDTTQLTYNQNSNSFRYKILSISKNKPKNVRDGQEFGGQFFIEVKFDDNLDSYILKQTGTGGNTGLITEDDVNWREVKTTPAEPRLHLGTYEDVERREDGGQDGSLDGFIITPVKYYYKNGEILYKVGGQYTSTTDGESVFDDNAATASDVSFCSLTLTATQFGTRFGGSVEWLDITGASLESKHTDQTEADALDASSNKYVEEFGSVQAVAVALAYGRGVPVAFQMCGISGTAAATANHTLQGTPAIFETVPEENLELDLYYETSESFNISEYGKPRTFTAGETNPSSQSQVLSFFNAFVIGNGVESNRIKDDLNEDTILNGLKASVAIDNQFVERTQKTGLIYSGIFNDQTNLNKLNEFNTGLKITKDLNPDYGSIQKLHTRNTDLIALCEDKILNIQANKDALFNADGSTNITSTNKVLGKALAYNGEYGISKNPESFASHGYSAFFVDKSRGVVLKLSGMPQGKKAGLEVISSKGMNSYFRENLLNETSSIQGSFDVYSDQYIVTIPKTGSGVSYKADVQGWVSRLSFLPDSGLSVNGNYYTCYNGELYKHHSKNVKRNNFYGYQYSSGITLILNQEPSAIKNFKTIGYEGTEGWLSQLNGIDVIVTDQQKGEIKSFTEKEGKFYSHISGVDESLDTIFGDELDDKIKNFSVQGLGNISSHSGTPATTSTSTLNTFTCSDAGFVVADGTLAATVTASVTAGTLVSVSPSLYKSAVNTYTGTITVPAGYSNTGTNIFCDDIKAVGIYINDSFGSGTNSRVNDQTTNCSFTLTTSSYANGAATITGVFGSNYTNTDVIKLEAPLGVAISISGDSSAPIETTKQALAAGLAVTTPNGTKVTATVTSGTCVGSSADVTLPLVSGTTVFIGGATPDTAFTYDTVRLFAETTGTITSYQWHKSTSSGFTPSDSTKIDEATLSYYDARETTADTIYYKVKINNSTISAEHDIVWSDRTGFTLRYSAGPSTGGALKAACSASSTTRDIFAETATFNTATQFFSNIDGTTSSFEPGTYSSSDNNTNNHYRYINDNGVPEAAISCNETGAAQVVFIATACRNSSLSKTFKINKATNVADPTTNQVVSFTAPVDGHTYWVIGSVSTSEVFEEVTLAGITNSGTCITQDAPTVSMTGAVQAFTGNNFNVNAVVSHTSQGGSYSYQFTRATSSGGTYSNLGNAQSSETKQTSEGTADEVFFKAVLNGSINSTNFLTVNVIDRPTYSNLKFTSGSSIANSATACKQSNVATLYGDQTGGIQFSRRLYSAATGSASSVTEGTYSNGEFYAFVTSIDGVAGSVQETTVTNDAFGTVTTFWHACGDFSANATFSIKDGDCASGSTSNSAAITTSTVLLTACPVNFTPTSYEWRRTPPGGTSSVVQTGISNTFGVSEGTASETAYIYACTAVGPDSEGTSVSKTDTHNITFSAPEQLLTVQACPAGTTYNIKITNAQGYTNNQVIKLNAASPVAAGSYKVTNASYSGSVQATTTVSDFQPYGSCCAAIGCSATVSMTVGGAASTSGAIAIGSTVLLTGAAVGYTASSYKWYISLDNGNSYDSNPVSTASQYEPVNSEIGSKTYKCTVTGTQGESESGTKTISWFGGDVKRYYLLQSFSTTCGFDDNITTGAFTSVQALPNETVVSLTESDICWKIVGSSAGDNSTPVIEDTFADCAACNTTKVTLFCNFNLFHNNTYPNPTFDMTGGSSILSTDTIRLTPSSGLIGGASFKDVTRNVLSNGYQVSVSEGVTITGTVTTGDCTNTTDTVVAPLSTCIGVDLFKAHSHPDGDPTSRDLLCGAIGNQKTIYLNKPTLAEASAVYIEPDCVSLAPYNTYLSTGNGQYYVWNSVTLNGPYNLNCQ